MNRLEEDLLSSRGHGHGHGSRGGAGGVGGSLAGAGGQSSGRLTGLLQPTSSSGSLPPGEEDSGGDHDSSMVRHGGRAMTHLW